MNSINFPIMLTFAVLGLLIQCAFIYFENKKDYKKAVILKGSASLCFLTVGIVGVIYSKDITFSSLILIGLLLGVIGDILLNLRFIFEKKSQKIFLAGTASFLLGHIFYIVAIFIYCGFRDHEYIWAPIVQGTLITFIVGYFIFTVLKVEKKLKIFGCVYIFIVSLFMSLADYNAFVNQNYLTLFSGIGSVLFFASDVILIFNSFGKKQRLPLRASNLLLYFIGQILIGFCLLF